MNPDDIANNWPSADWRSRTRSRRIRRSNSYTNFFSNAPVRNDEAVRGDEDEEDDSGFYSTGASRGSHFGYDPLSWPHEVYGDLLEEKYKNGKLRFKKGKKLWRSKTMDCEFF